MTNEELTAYHEAAHAVAARALELHVSLVTVDPVIIVPPWSPQFAPSNKSVAGMTDVPQPEPEHSQRRIDSYFVVRLIGDEFDRTYGSPEQVSDEEMQRALLGVRRLVDRDAYAYLEDLRPRARELLERPKIMRRIIAVGTGLLERKTLTCTQLDELIAVADAGRR